MAKVLAPCLELFWRLAAFFAELDKRIPKTVRIVMGQAGRLECVAKDCPDRSCVAPVFTD